MPLTQAQITGLKLINPRLTYYQHFDGEFILYNRWTIFSKYGSQRKWRKSQYQGAGIVAIQNLVLKVIGKKNVSIHH